MSTRRLVIQCTCHLSSSLTRSISCSTLFLTSSNRSSLSITSSKADNRHYFATSSSDASSSTFSARNQSQPSSQNRTRSSYSSTSELRPSSSSSSSSSTTPPTQKWRSQSRQSMKKSYVEDPTWQSTTLSPRIGRALENYLKLDPESRRREDLNRQRLLRTMSAEKLYALERERERLSRIDFETKGDKERQALIMSAKNVGAKHVLRKERERERERDGLRRPDAVGVGGKSRMIPGRANRELWHGGEDKDRKAVKPVIRGRLPDQKQGATSKKPNRRPRTLKKVTLPSTVRLENLTRILGVRLSTLQKTMQRIGLDNTRPERLLTAEDASLVALEFNFDPTIDDEAAFDLYPLPIDESVERPLRPPITGIFGHVDHGKTSLLDALRKTAVAKGEAGGITQHIGAFEVEVDAIVKNLSDGKKGTSTVAMSSGGATITFLDTPGHAAFTAMRERGAGVTDVVVLVVAADDGVKPQTEEVIGLIKSADVGVVVAITKVDKPGVDTLKVKQGLMAAGVEIEEFGGDIPCVEVSSVTGQGLPTLVETISAIAEIRDLRAERSGRVEGRVIESRVEKGRGNVATILVLRGCLRATASLVAGTTWCRVRSLQPPIGKPVSLVYPGQPIEVTGWKELPSAGDLVLEAATEDEAKKAVANRLRSLEQKKLWEEVELINEKRQAEAEIEAVRREEEAKALARGLRRSTSAHLGRIAGDVATEAANTSEIKELLLVIKADVSGTVEAVVGALEGIGNAEAKVKIVSSAVGDVQESDVEMARAIGAAVVGFNVKAPASVAKLAARQPNPVKIISSSIIYRLVDSIRAAVSDLLPKTIEVRVHGEALVQQLFEISVKGRTGPMKVAGCKVSNGVFQKVRKARVVRNGEVLFTGTVETLKQVKKDVTEIPKGVECGIALEGFDAFQEQDLIQSVEEIEVARSL